MSDNQSVVLKNYTDNIENHIQHALAVAISMQQYVLSTEGDSDLHRKLSMYLIPNLTHWVNGAQAGNMKDLNETLARRLATQTVGSEQSHSGDGHDVLINTSN